MIFPAFIFNPPEADKGLIPRPLGRIKITDGYPVACSGVVHSFSLSNTGSELLLAKTMQNNAIFNIFNNIVLI
jgi:hypothetical protein